MSKVLIITYCDNCKHFSKCANACLLLNKEIKEVGESWGYHHIPKECPLDDYETTEVTEI